MNTMSWRMSSILMVFLVLISFGTMTGCSGGGGSSSSVSSGGDTGGGSTNPYSGDAAISGSIDTASLSSSDQALLAKHLPKGVRPGTKLYRQLYAADFTTDAMVKLYVVGEDGSLTDTDITGTITLDADGNPTFSFDGVADGLNYVIRYVKLIGDGQALELKTNVEVPEGATAPASDPVISPKTTVVVETLISAILDATNGTGISQEIVNNIIAAVKAAIETLVNSGAIVVPSMVVEASGTTIDEIVAEDLANDDLENASGTLLSDSSVDQELGAVKATTLAERFDLASVTTDTAKEALIDRVFDEMMDGDSVPDFMLAFFTDLYVANTTRTVSQMMDAIAAGLMFRPDVPTPNISKSQAITAFQTELQNIYTLLDAQAAGTLTDAQKQELAEIPPVILGLFPISERTAWSSLSGSTSLNVPQAIAMTIYIVDVYISDAFADLQATFTATEGDGGAGVSYSKEEPFDFDPMVPGSIMDILGFYTNNTYQQYAGVDIFDLWMNPGKAWIEGTNGGPGTEVDMLMAGTCIADVSQMVAQMFPNLGLTPTDLSSATVTLSYPKVGGTRGTIDLVSEASLMPVGMGGPGGMGETCFILDPWREATAGQDPSTITGPVQPDVTRIVSDFTSGTYTVSITVNGDTTTKDFTKKVITGMSNAYPTLVTPRGFPNYPGNNATQAEMDAFNTAMQEFNTNGPTRFTANVDTNSDGTNDAAKITVTWAAPTVTLPTGVKMGYNLDLGQGGCDQNGCTWEHIFSTWDHNKTLFTTAFTVPVNLPQDNVTPYQINVNVVFIDSTTGEMLGQGGNAHAEFWVAEPIDLTTVFNITGAVSGDATGYKAVLIQEKENPDSLTNRFTRTAILEGDIVSGAYTLSPTIGDFLDPANAGAWYNIVLYQDSDGSGGFTNADMQLWPDWNSGVNVWFNTWGGMLRVGQDVCTPSSDPSVPPTCTHSETVITGLDASGTPTTQTVTGPSFAISSQPVGP